MRTRIPSTGTDNRYSPSLLHAVVLISVDCKEATLAINLNSHTVCFPPCLYRDCLGGLNVPETRLNSRNPTSRWITKTTSANHISHGHNPTTAGTRNSGSKSSQLPGTLLEKSNSNNLPHKKRNGIAISFMTTSIVVDLFSTPDRIQHV